ncbi:hypothetical protein GCM10009575_048660 [Streptomyces rhizosphaericus]|uniref:Uncharacterized protein n=1 Tax=Streptomyces rhizosphaericus TaxID=114699 RepID=A0ABN1Q3W1_9ACTN
MRIRSKPASSWARAKRVVYSGSITGPVAGRVSEASWVSIMPMNSTDDAGVEAEAGMGQLPFGAGELHAKGTERTVPRERGIPGRSGGRRWSATGAGPPGAVRPPGQRQRALEVRR